MANKLAKKRCSISYVTREMQFKTTMRYNYTPIRMAQIQNYDNTKCWSGCGATGTLMHCWWECKNGVVTLEDSLATPYKIKHTPTI